MSDTGKIAPTNRAAVLLALRKLCSINFFYVLFLTLLAQEMLGVITYRREEVLHIRAMVTHQHYDQEYDFLILCLYRLQRGNQPRRGH